MARSTLLLFFKRDLPLTTTLTAHPLSPPQVHLYTHTSRHCTVFCAVLNREPLIQKLFKETEIADMMFFQEESLPII